MLQCQQYLPVWVVRIGIGNKLLATASISPLGAAVAISSAGCSFNSLRFFSAKNSSQCKKNVASLTSFQAIVRSVNHYLNGELLCKVLKRSDRNCPSKGPSRSYCWDCAWRHRFTVWGSSGLARSRSERKHSNVQC